MSRSIELTTGQNADLPPGYLGVRLTGAVSGARLSAIWDDGTEVHESREGDGEVVVRPQGGRIRLVAAPLGAATFEESRRIGAELSTVTVGQDSPQLLVANADAGALRELVVATAVFTDGRGWDVTAGIADEADDFSFLLAPAPTVSADALDDETHPWLLAGRYFLRRAAGGTVTKQDRNRRWSLVVDDSASVRSVFPALRASFVVDRISGVLAEASGRLAEAVGVTGGMSPSLTDNGRAEPAALLDDAEQNGASAPWCLVTPALREAVAAGADVIAVVTDGPPADIESMLSLVRDGSAVRVVFVLILDSGGLPADAMSDVRELAMGAFAAVRAAPQVQVGVIDLAERAHDEQWVELAGILAGVTR